MPDGFSILSLTLGPIWAFANGLIVEHIVIMMVFAIPAALAGMAGIGLVAALIVCAGFVYFAKIAHKLRAKDLLRYGYAKVATIESSSARNALRGWAESDDAARFLETGVVQARDS